MNVVNNSAERRFEIKDGEQLAYLTYVLRRHAIALVHTEVPQELAGRGYGNDLAHAALEYARETALRVVPICPFVQGYLERHPEYAKLTQRRVGGAS